MATIAHTPPQFHPRIGLAAERGPLKLVTSPEGWALLDPSGREVFSAPGLRGRRRCLQFAHAHGVLAVLS